MSIRISLANLAYPATSEASIASATSAVAAAGAVGAAIVCFPECYVPGYRAAGSKAPDDRLLADALLRVGAAARAAGIAVILGTERVAAGKRHICAAVFGPDGMLLGFQDKVQLDPTEEAPFEPAPNSRPVFDLKGVTVGISICHEGFRYPETVRACVRQGAQIVFHPHATFAENGSHRPTSFGEPANTFHEKAVLCRAAENSCYVASVNYASEGSPTTSAIAGPDGEVIAWQPYGREGLLVADLDLARAHRLLAKRLR